MDLELEDLKLLCPDGTEADLFQYERCHLAVVPTNAVVVRLEDKCRVYKYLERVQVRRDTNMHTEMFKSLRISFLRFF